MSSSNLFLISDLAEDKTFAEEVAIVSKLSLRCMNDFKSSSEMIAAEEPAVIMVNMASEAKYQEFEASIQNAVGLFSDKINANAIHFLSSENIEKVQYLVQSPLFGHYILRNYSDPKEAGRHYGRVVLATQTERAFGLSKLMKEGSKIQSVKLTVSTMKHDAVEAVKAFLIAAKFQTRMAALIANAVDELLLNGIFDAPIDELGKQLYSRTPRSTVLQLNGSSEVEMHVGFDGEYVAVSVVDHFGSLDKLRLLTHISKIYREEEYKVRSSVANAGIGLATVFRTGGSFFFVSESRTRTEVTVFFKKTFNFREFKDQFRFISTQFYF